MATSFQGLSFYDAAGTSQADGVFLPIAALPGLNASELVDTEPDHVKYSKALNAICEKLYSAISATNFPGAISLSANKLAPAGAGLNLINQSFSFSFTKVLNLKSQTIIEVPEPTTGNNNGIGSIDFPDIFPLAEKVNNNDPVAAGVVVSTSLLTPYASFSHSSLSITGSNDNREAIAALITFLGQSAVTRNTTQASAVVAKTIQAVPTIGAVPANFTTLPNPLSGIDPNDLIVRALITRTCTITFNYTLNVSAQTFDVNSVTA